MKDTTSPLVCFGKLFVALAALASIPLQATTTTVSSTSALVSAVSAASPGDTILLADGTYTGTFTLSCNGSVGNMITVRAANPGQAVFTGKTSIFITSSYMYFSDFMFDRCQHDATDTYREVVKVKTSNHVVISNNHFYQCGDVDYPGWAVLKFYVGSTANTLMYNTFEGSLSISVGISNTDTDYTNTNNFIYRNYFKDILPVGTVHPGETNGMECMQIGSSRSYTDLYTFVAENLFERVTGDGAEMISNKTSSNSFHRNTFRDCPSMLTLRMGDDCRVEGNFFFNTKGGIRVYGTGHVIANNYVEGAYSTNAALYCPAGDATHVPASSTKFLNNTVINSTYFGIRISSSGATSNPSSLTFKNNLISIIKGSAITDYIGGLGSYVTNMVSLSGTATQGVTGSGIQSISVPLTQVGLLKRPGSSSPVIGAGTTDAGITLDMDGQPRGSTFDVGADQISSATVVYLPLVAADVGALF